MPRVGSPGLAATEVADVAAIPTTPTTPGEPVHYRALRPCGAVPSALRPTELLPGELPGAARTRRVAPLPAWVAGWRPGTDLGQCPPDGTHLHLILDESGSVASVADPIAYRHELLRRLLTCLPDACTCGSCTVDVTLFPPWAGTGSQSSPVGHWERADMAELADWLACLPSTSSSIGPALRKGQPRLAAAGTHTVIAITDLELHDSDPGAQLRKLASMPNPLVIRLGDNSNPSPTGLPKINVGSDADRTAIGDAVAAHVGAQRGQVNPQATKRTRLRRVPWKWLVAFLLAAAALATAGVLASRDSDTAVASPTQPSADAERNAEVPPGGSPPDLGFALPPPAGTAPRTVPLTTQWIIDASSGPANQSHPSLATELPAVVQYQARYGIDGDELTIGVGVAMRTIASVEQLTGQAKAAAPLRQDPGRTINHIQAKTARKPTADRSVVVVTNRPDAWLVRLPSLPARPATPGVVRPEIQWYIVDLNTEGNLSQQAARGPWVLPGAGGEPGSTAKAMAFAFVDATGATWQG